jgi:hypothetical protein
MTTKQTIIAIIAAAAWVAVFVMALHKAVNL